MWASEIAELVAVDARGDRVKELAGLLEVVEALLENEWSGWDGVRRVQHERRVARRWFSRRLVLRRTEVWG